MKNFKVQCNLIVNYNHIDAHFIGSWTNWKTSHFHILQATVPVTWTAASTCTSSVYNSIHANFMRVILHVFNRKAWLHANTNQLFWLKIYGPAVVQLTGFYYRSVWRWQMTVTFCTLFKLVKRSLIFILYLKIKWIFFYSGLYGSGLGPEIPAISLT